MPNPWEPDGPPTDEDRCDLSGPEGPAGLGTPDESVAGVHGKDGGFALSGTSWGRIGGTSCTGRRLRSRGNPASLPTRRLPRPSLPRSPGILRPRPSEAGRAIPGGSCSSCRSCGEPSSGRLGLPSLLSQLMSEPELEQDPKDGVPFQRIHLTPLLLKEVFSFCLILQRR
jgi:hypothetical protein